MTAIGANLTKTYTADELSTSGIGHAPGDRYMSYNGKEYLFAQANGLYLCTQWGFADNFSSIDLVLVEYDPDIETDWNAPVDEQSFALANLDVS